MSLSSTRRRGIAGLCVEYYWARGLSDRDIQTAVSRQRSRQKYQRYSEIFRLTARSQKITRSHAQQYAPRGHTAVHFARQRTRQQLSLTPDLRPPLSPSPLLLPSPLPSSPQFSPASPLYLLLDTRLVICLLRPSVALPGSLPLSNPPRVRPAVASPSRALHSSRQMRTTTTISTPPRFSMAASRPVPCRAATRFE